jgi:L-threonylcarbamoyladenylate synthase
LRPLDPELLAKISRSWPGPYTWLLPAHHKVSPLLRGAHDSLAVRVTAHPAAAALCRRAGCALVSTSANRQGRPPARSAAAVRREFGDGVDFILVGRLGRQARPTQIRDARSGKLIRGA